MLGVKDCPFFALFFLCIIQVSKLTLERKSNNFILASHVVAQAKAGTKLNSNTHFPKPLSVETGGRPSPQALATLDDQVVARHVVRGFGGQVDDGSLQVGGLGQPPGGNVGQPAPHQRPQLLRADERRVHDAPAASTRTKGLATGPAQKERQHREVFEMLIQKENSVTAQRRWAHPACSALAESHGANFHDASFPSSPFAADAQLRGFLSSTHTHTQSS